MIANFDDQLFIKGALLIIPVGSTTAYVDTDFDFDVSFTGGTIFTKDTKIGDYGSMTIEHPDPQYGTLATFAETAYLPEGNQTCTVLTPDHNGATIPEGLKLRLTVTAVDTLGREIVFWFWVRK